MGSQNASFLVRQQRSPAAQSFEPSQLPTGSSAGAVGVGVGADGASETDDGSLPLGDVATLAGRDDCATGSSAMLGEVAGLAEEGGAGAAVPWGALHALHSQ